MNEKSEIVSEKSAMLTRDPSKTTIMKAEEVQSELNMADLEDFQIQQKLNTIMESHLRTIDNIFDLDSNELKN